MTKPVSIHTIIRTIRPLPPKAKIEYLFAESQAEPNRSKRKTELNRAAFEINFAQMRREVGRRKRRSA